MAKFMFFKFKNNPFGYFLIKATLFLVALHMVDFLGGNTLRYFYFNQVSGQGYRMTNAIEKTTADVIIFGSSRANHHYHPEVFQKRLNQSYYNVGVDGSYLVHNYAVLKSILMRHRPKAILLDIVAQEFMKNQNKFDRLSILLPYYKEHPEIHEIIEMRSSTEKLKLQSQIYPFNSLLFSIAIGNLELNKKRKPDIAGYLPIMKKWSGPLNNNDMPAKYEIDSTTLKIFQSFIEDCKRLNIKLFIICSPYLVHFNEPIYSIALAKEIAEKENVVFLDYSMDSLFINNSSLFADPSHLNDDGAKLFSGLLIDDIYGELKK